MTSTAQLAKRLNRLSVDETAAHAVVISHEGNTPEQIAGALADHGISPGDEAYCVNHIVYRIVNPDGTVEPTDGPISVSVNR